MFQNELFLPLRKDLPMRRICPTELKFSGFVVLSKFCGMSIELFHPLDFVKVMHSNISMLIGKLLVFYLKM